MLYQRSSSVTASVAQLRWTSLAHREGYATDDLKVVVADRRGPWWGAHGGSLMQENSAHSQLPTTITSIPPRFHTLRFLRNRTGTCRPVPAEPRSGTGGPGQHCSA